MQTVGGGKRRHAMTCGLAPIAAVTIYSVEGFAGLGGRLALGVLADRLGVKRVPNPHSLSHSARMLSRNHRCAGSEVWALFQLM